MNWFSVGNKSQESATTKNRPALSMAVLMVNGRFNYKNRLWLELSLERIFRHTSRGTDLRVFLWNHDNQNPTVLKYLESVQEQVEVLDAASFDVDAWNGVRSAVDPERFDYFSRGVHVHRGPLQILFEHACQNYDIGTIFTFDTDSWPIRDNWDLPLRHSLEHGVALAGIWRDELRIVIPPYVHPSCLGIRAETVKRLGLRFDVEPVPRQEDTLSHFTRAVVNESGADAIYALRRSNRTQFHSVFGGVYDYSLYHHHLGTRYKEGAEQTPQSYGWQERGETPAQNKFILDALTEMAFERTDDLVEELCYGPKAIDYRIYRAYLRNIGDEACGSLFHIAREVVTKDPMEAFYIVGLIGKRLIDNSEFLEFAARLSDSLGRQAEAASYRARLENPR